MTNSTSPLKPLDGSIMERNLSNGATTSGLWLAPAYSPNMPNVGPNAKAPFSYFGMPAAIIMACWAAIMPDAMAVPANGM